MQYKCQICHDTGNKEKDMGGHLTCIACEAPAERMALEAFIESLPAMGEQEQAWAIHQRALAMAPKQEAPAAAFDAATFIENKAAAYLDENASTDPDDGSTIFHYGSAGSEYYNGLVELAEEIRIAAPAAANGALGYAEKASPIAITDSSALNGIRWYVPPPEHLRNGMQLYFVAPQPVAASGPDAALIESLEVLLGLVDEFGIKSGVCCCGDDMARHSNPMDCGHSPVDSGEYYSAQTIEVARAALSGAKGN